jgi:hypothetical protein
VEGAQDPYPAAARSISQATAAVADYCDSVEHNETLCRDWVLDAGSVLRAESVALGKALGKDVFDLYAQRLGSIEQRGVAGTLPDSPDGEAAARGATTWLDLQLVQLRHDRHFHFDVAGLSNLDQLRHYAFHLAKLTGAYVAAQDDQEVQRDIAERRLADTLLFGIKLATVMGQRLDPEPLPRRSG